MATITFTNQRGEVLLRETGPANALALRSRRFEPQLGGDYQLTVTFEGAFLTLTVSVAFRPFWV